MKLASTMSSGEKHKDVDAYGDVSLDEASKDVVTASGDMSEDEQIKDVVLRDDEEEEGESSDEDNESDGDEEDDGDEETDDEEIDNADADEGVSEEDDGEGETEDEEDGEEDDTDDDDEDEAEEGQGEELDTGDVSSGDENTDRCPICLNSLRKQDIGNPESCDHAFCLECIQEWAKNVNTCPVDRQIFRIILARHAGEEKIFKQIPVEDKQQEKEEEEDPTYCEVCGQSNREDRLLLCDRCDLGYHCDCLDPPLASVPVHEWFCPDCQQDRNTESGPLSSGRQIARTRVSERVRRLIAEARAERAERRRRVTAMIVAQEALENEGLVPGPSASGASTSPAKAERKKTTRKRKTYRRKTTRKKTKKRKTKKKTGKKTKTRRKRKSKGKGKRKTRKTKKPFSSISSPAFARTAISRAVTSVKGRIADRLGLSKPPAGRSIPMQKLPPSGARQEGAARSSMDHGASAFSLLGSRDELYLFADQEGEERQPAHRPAIPAESLLSKSAKSSHKPLSFSLTKKKPVVKEAPTSSTCTSPAAGGFDLLGSILQNQDLLHKGSKHVTINRDGSLSAINISSSVRATTSATGVATTSSTQLSSTTDARKYNNAQSSSSSDSLTEEIKPAEITSSSKLKLPKSVSLDNMFSSGSETSEKSEAENDTLPTLSGSSKILSSPHPDLTTEIVKFEVAASSDEELQAVDTVNDLVLPVKKENTSNCDGTVPWNKANNLMPESKSTSSSLENSCVEGTQTFSAVKSEREMEMISGTNVDYGINCGDSYNEDAYYSNRSSSNSTGLHNGAISRDSFADTPVTEQESKPSLGSECSSNEIDHNLSINNSPEIGSRESDSVLTTHVNGSSQLHAMDVNSGVDLEADAVFSNNARLNAEEDVGNNSVGFSTTVSSLANLRNFAAVASDISNVHDDSLGIMKRNFNLLVSTSSNLAGYESGDENDNIERFMQLPNDREEGEASDSNEEGEVREFEDRQRTVDDQEEGEIVDEEERDRWAISRNTCEENDNEDSGGLDVNAIHIEEMEIGTFRKRSMSQNEDVNNEGSKKIKIEEETTPDTETKIDNESGKEDKDSEADVNTGKPVGRSFMLYSLISSLKTNEIDGNDNSEKGGGEEEKEIKQEDEKENEDLTMKPISILDFIGDASAKKFGLPVVDKDSGRADHNFGQPREGGSYAGGNSYGYRGSRPYVNRRYNHTQRERRDGEIEEGHEEKEAVPPRIFDRRRGSWQEEDRSRQRSGSRDSQGANQRSAPHDNRSMKPHHGRKEDAGRRRRDDESRDRSRRSRSHSGSPRRRTDKRRRDADHEVKDRQTRKGKKSRWNHEDEDQDKNVEENVEKQDKEVEKKTESSGLSTTQSNGYPPTPAPDRHQHSAGHYQPHQYQTGMTAYSYPGAPGPPLPSSRPPAPPPPHSHPSYPHVQPPNHPRAPHPGLPFSHPGSLAQSPYSQIHHGPPPLQQTAQTRHPHHEVKPPHHQGFPTSYYPQVHPSSVIQKAPPPPPHPYPHPVYPVCYPPASGQSAANIAHPNPHIPTTNQPHSGYPRYPQPMAHPYPQTVPHATYPPRQVAPNTTSSAVYTPTATSVYPPQQPIPTSSTPSVPRHGFNTAAVKPEPNTPHTAATIKPESSVPRNTGSLKQESKTSASNPAPVHPETHKMREAVKESASSDVKSARTSYPISPPTAPIKGVTTYDKVDSSILLNEVKKGFRQLVEDAIRSALKGAWSSKKVTKEEYKDIFKRAVEKVCGSKETVVNQEKIQSLVNAYVMKARKARKAIPA